MNKLEQQRVLNTLVDHLTEETTADAGGIMRVPMSDFTRSELLVREQETFFRDTPLCMGLSSELPEPNTYWSDTSTGVPILMVRDAEGRFQAFANICRHRASQVVPEGHGSADRFTCPFHAWTYGNDGSLLAINKRNHFAKNAKLDMPLFALPSAEFHGTLWIRPTQGDALEENECLTGLDDDFSHWNLSEHIQAGFQIIDARMNWKLMVDSFGEIYHLSILHKNTVANEVIGNVQTLDKYDRHLRMVIANPKINLVRMLMPQPETWPYKQTTTTVYFVFPNVIMLIDAFGIDFLRVFPLDSSPSKARTIHTWYITPKMRDRFKENNMSFEDRLARFRESVEMEDYTIGAHIQANAECGIQEEILLGRNEGSLQHFQNVRRAALGRKLLEVVSH